MKKKYFNIVTISLLLLIMVSTYVFADKGNSNKANDDLVFEPQFVSYCPYSPDGLHHIDLDTYPYDTKVVNDNGSTVYLTKGRGGTCMHCDWLVWVDVGQYPLEHYADRSHTSFDVYKGEWTINQKYIDDVDSDVMKIYN